MGFFHRTVLDYTPWENSLQEIASGESCDTRRPLKGTRFQGFIGCFGLCHGTPPEWSA